MTDHLKMSRRVFLASGGALALGTTGLLPEAALALPDPDIAGYIDIPEGKLWYRINGAAHLGGPKAPLLCLHGGPGGNSRSMISLLALADERAVIFYDQLNGGKSTWSDDKSTWTVEHYLGEIPQVRAALGLDRVILVGHSMGTGWSVEYTAEMAPDGVEALILGSPYLSTADWIEDAKLYREDLPAEVREVLEAKEATDTYDDDYWAASSVYSDRHYCIAPCEVGDMANDAPPFNGALYDYVWGPSDVKVSGTLKDYDVTPLLAKIEQPTLVFSGSADAASPATAKRYAERLPNGEFVVIPDAGHNVYQEQPEAVVTAVRGFLEAQNL